MWLFLRLSFEDLIRDRSRTLLSLMGLAFVIASYFILAAMSDAFSYYLNNTDLSRNLIIIEKDVFDPADAVLGQEVITAVQDLIPGMINRISPFIFRHTNAGGKVLMLRSAEQEDWEPVFHLELVAGSWPDVSNEIVVDEGFANANQWDIGSNLQIFGAQLKISGLYRAPSAAFASIWMPISTFKQIFKLKSGYQALYAQISIGVDPEVVRTRLENDPRLKGTYAVYFEDNYVRRNTQALQEMSSLNLISSLVALLGIIFGIYNAVSLSTVEHGFEIGILLGIGFSKTSIRCFLLVRTVWLILLAYITGLILALVYTTIQKSISPLFIFGLSLNLRITAVMAITGLCLVVILSALGTWLSTRRLFDLQIVELLGER